MYRFLQLSCLIWLLLLVAHTLAAAAAAPERHHHLEARQQSAGSACSDEGQWNCMTSSWQRCAAGRWSVTMQCAKGTTCSPAGLTRDFRIQHDGSVNGNGGPPTTSSGTRSWAPRIGMLGLVMGWCCW